MGEGSYRRCAGCVSCGCGIGLFFYYSASTPNHLKGTRHHTTPRLWFLLLPFHSLLPHPPPPPPSSTVAGVGGFVGERAMDCAGDDDAVAAGIICSLRGADLAGWTPPWWCSSSSKGAAREELIWPPVTRGKRSRRRSPSAVAAAAGKKGRWARASPASPLDYSGGSGSGSGSASGSAASTSGGEDGAFCSPPGHRPAPATTKVSAFTLHPHLLPPPSCRLRRRRRRCFGFFSSPHHYSLSYPHVAFRVFFFALFRFCSVPCDGITPTSGENPFPSLGELDTAFPFPFPFHLPSSPPPPRQFSISPSTTIIQFPLLCLQRTQPTHPSPFPPRRSALLPHEQMRFWIPHWNCSRRRDQTAAGRNRARIVFVQWLYGWK